MQSISEPTLKRLPRYLMYLKQVRETGKENISGPGIAHDLGLDPTQVTKDLSVLGLTGKTRVGFEVNELIVGLEEFLGFRRKNEAFLVGAGKLGQALMNYESFADYGLKIVAAFDTNKSIIGEEINKIQVFPIEKFRDLASRLHIIFGIITTPASSAQFVADMMVSWGIKAIWNFAPVNLKLPSGIVVQNTSLYEGLAVMYNKIQSILDAQPLNNKSKS